MDGIACISILQATQTYKSIPIVVLSSDTSQIEVVRKMGARAFIKKTSDLKALTAQIVQALAIDQTSDFFTNARDHNRL
jgi:DNA-binding NarL/FixJ family response regulator